MSQQDNVEKQLAREEALLKRTRDEIAATREGIEEAERQGALLRERLAELERETEAVEKRIALLRQYIEMAPPGEPEESGAAEPDWDEEETGYPLKEAPQEDEVEEVLPDLDPSLIDNVQVGAPPSGSASRAKSSDAASSFDDLDEEILAMELLPRTQTFEEELLLILAYHRKAVEPKDVSRLFRRLDHTPKTKPTENNVKAQIASAPHHYEQTNEGRIALSQEGREEAQRLLMSLA